MKNKIQALIFDLDDTLIDSDSAYPRSLKAIGLDPKNKTYQSARAAVKKLLPPGSPSARNRLMYFKQMMRESGAGLSTQKLLAVTLMYEKALYQDLHPQWK